MLSSMVLTCTSNVFCSLFRKNIRIETFLFICVVIKRNRVLSIIASLGFG